MNKFIIHKNLKIASIGISYQTNQTHLNFNLKFNVKNTKQLYMDIFVNGLSSGFFFYF